MFPIKKILVPIDFSEQSRKALEYAMEFGRQCQAKIYLLFVISLEDLEAIEKARLLLVNKTFESLVAEREEYELKQLKKFLPEDKAKGLEIEFMIGKGRPFYEIIKTAKELKVNLIIISAHGRSNIPHMIFGHVADRVVHKAPCPVLTLRYSRDIEPLEPEINQ